MSAIAAVVAGQSISIDHVDERERRLRAVTPAAALPRPGTSEGRQLRRWLTQLIVTEHVIDTEAARRGITADGAPELAEVLPDAVARHEIGSIAAAALAEPLARNVFRQVTADVAVTDAAVSDYHRRNPHRFATTIVAGPWRAPAGIPAFEEVRPLIAAHLLGAARRRAFRIWLDGARAEQVTLAPGYEHPGDPRQPDNVHRH